MRCGLRRRDIAAWIRDYDNLQSLAVKLIYVQIGCALIGSLGPLYNGILLLNLGISLFGLVAIESSSQPLARTYAFLLYCSILLDISWFLLFSRDIWFFQSELYGTFVNYLVKLILAMQIVGFSVRLTSSLLWIQMYRLGFSHVVHSVSRDTDSDLRNSFLNPVTPIAQHCSGCDHSADRPLYDPSFFPPPFEEGRDDTYSRGVSQIQEASSADSFCGVASSPPPGGPIFS